jgi:hypothetical protein
MNCFDMRHVEEEWVATDVRTVRDLFNVRGAKGIKECARWLKKGSAADTAWFSVTPLTQHKTE